MIHLDRMPLHYPTPQYPTPTIPHPTIPHPYFTPPSTLPHPYYTPPCNNTPPLQYPTPTIPHPLHYYLYYYHIALTNLIEFHQINLTNWSRNIFIKNIVENGILLPVPFVFIFYLVYTYYFTPVQSNRWCKK